MSAEAVREQGCGIVFVVSAPSGSGKSTLVRRLRDAVGGLGFGVSHTTRPRRPGEIAGSDYDFVDEARFRAMAQADEFLEWAEVHGGLYGTSRAALRRILEAGDDALLDLDVQGAEAVRRLLPEAVLVFLLPPDYAELQRRLEARGTPAAEIERRLETARGEVRRAEGFDYLVVNDDVEDAGALLASIVLAERSRRARRGDTWERIVATFPVPEDGRRMEGT